MFIRIYPGTAFLDMTRTITYKSYITHNWLESFNSEEGKNYRILILQQTILIGDRPSRIKPKELHRRIDTYNRSGAFGTSVYGSWSHEVRTWEEDLDISTPVGVKLCILL